MGANGNETPVLLLSRGPFRRQNPVTTFRFGSRVYPALQTPFCFRVLSGPLISQTSQTSHFTIITIAVQVDRILIRQCQGRSGPAIENTRDFARCQQMLGTVNLHGERHPLAINMPGSLQQQQQQRHL